MDVVFEKPWVRKSVFKASETESEVISNLSGHDNSWHFKSDANGNVCSISVRGGCLDLPNTKLICQLKFLRHFYFWNLPPGVLSSFSPAHQVDDKLLEVLLDCSQLSWMRLGYAPKITELSVAKSFQHKALRHALFSHASISLPVCESHEGRLDSLCLDYSKLSKVADLESLCVGKGIKNLSLRGCFLQKQYAIRLSKSLPNTFIRWSLELESSIFLKSGIEVRKDQTVWTQDE